MGFGPFPGPMFRHTDGGPFGPDFHSHIAQMPPMPPMNLGKSYGLPDGLQNIQPLVGKRIAFPNNTSYKLFQMIAWTKKALIVLWRKV